MADQRIRVAHVITRMIVGGAQETVLLAAALANRDRFDPVIVCGPQTGSEGSLHDEVRRRGIELVLVPELVREVHPVQDVRVVSALARLFRDRRIDVVHTNSSKAGIVGRIAAHRAHVPLVLHTVHGWPFHDQQLAPASAVWKMLERRTARLARHLVVVADADRDKGLSAGIGQPEQYVTIRSGLELAEYRTGRATRAAVRAELSLAADAAVVVAVNRLSAQKDPLTLVDAFARVHEQLPGSRLLVVGDGPLRPAVEQRLELQGLSSSVVLTGLRRDVPRLLAAADVFVSTSLWEGLPRTVIAAMASRVPVVATPVDGIVDVVADGTTGLLAGAGDARALGDACLTVLRNPALGKVLADAASQRVDEFSAAAMVRRLELLYDGVRLAPSGRRTTFPSPPLHGDGDAGQDQLDRDLDEP